MCVFNDRMHILRCFRCFGPREPFCRGQTSCPRLAPVLKGCSAVWRSAAETHLKQLHRVVSGVCFELVVCSNATLHKVDLLQYYVWCCIWSGVTLCTLFKMHYMCQMFQWGLHAVLWSHIGMLMRLFAAVLRSAAGLSSPSKYMCGVEWFCWPWIGWCGAGRI